MEVVVDRDVWRLNLELLPPQHLRIWAGAEGRRRYSPRRKPWCRRINTLCNYL